MSEEKKDIATETKYEEIVFQNVGVPGHPAWVPSRPVRKASAMFWLTFFFGNLGIGRFYMGHLGLGFAYMFTLGFLLIGPIVDLFICRKVTRKENFKRGYGYVTK